MSIQNIYFLRPPPPQKVDTSTFFKWTICHENDIKKMGQNVESVWNQDFSTIKGTELFVVLTY